MNIITKALKKFMRQNFRHTRSLFKATPDTFRDYAEQINEPEKKIYYHYIYCCYRYGIRPHQYIKFDFYRLNYRARKKYVCNVQTNRICDKANIFRHKKEMNVFANKPLFNELFRMEIGRDYIVAKRGGVSEVLAFLKSHSLIVIKPLNSKGGDGVKKIDVTFCDPKKLAEEICESNLLIEEIVEQCEEMARLNRSSVNTIRVVNVRDKFSNVHTVGCTVRVGRRGMFVDNVSSGGIVFPIDVEKGYICGKGIDEAGHLYDFHPDSGQLIIGFQIPRWRELLAFAVKAMDIVPQQRLVGWDVCIGADRFYLIEGNLKPGSITFECDGIGKKHLLELAI